MSELFADIGWKSINHHGEQLCGDHVEIVSDGRDDQVIVLADGLGSGVKASILSTLTSKIISTMMAQGLPLEECVDTIAATLPIDAEKHVAYSTFTIIRITNGKDLELIQFENPAVILLRGTNTYEYPRKTLEIGGKKILHTSMKLRDGDVLIAMSDGCPNASVVRTYNYGWGRDEIADYMKIFAPVGYSAKTLATMLVDECFHKYGEIPQDDATACVVCIRRRNSINVLFGPPSKPELLRGMQERFFAAQGKHIICGGTTAQLSGEYLNRSVRPLNNTGRDGIPPISELEGVDLVTEGVITLNRVAEYAIDNLHENELYGTWIAGKDGASRIARMLLEEGTDIRFFIGKAINPAYQNPELPVSFNLKMSIAEKLIGALREMNKYVEVQYY